MTNVTSTTHVFHTVRGETLKLLPEKAIYWEKKNALLIADLHIGKVTHFRNNHIPIPSQAALGNFENLEWLIQKYQPQTIYFLGDLFHSYYNKEWDLLSFLLAKYKKVKFILITGNHDVLKDEDYQLAGIECVASLNLAPFLLTHHPLEVSSKLYNLSGHIHPGVRLRGEGKQSLRLPCYYFGKEQGILPAFGNFTGLAIIKPRKEDSIYTIVQEKVLKLGS